MVTDTTTTPFGAIISGDKQTKNLCSMSYIKDASWANHWDWQLCCYPLFFLLVFFLCNHWKIAVTRTAKKKIALQVVPFLFPRFKNRLTARTRTMKFTPKLPQKQPVFHNPQQPNSSLYGLYSSQNLLGYLASPLAIIILSASFPRKLTWKQSFHCQNFKRISACATHLQLP